MDYENTSKPLSQRQLKVGETLKKIIANLFIKDQIVLPSISTRNITISEVRVSPDLRHARVYFMPLSGNEPEVALKILNQFSYEVKKRVKTAWTAKFLPNLKFVLDQSFDYAEKIEKIIIENSKSK
ncbi:MAG: 30S ribosome-binding factor RbfA [Proteobacteria bacterium]|jgi:ribosome-binding factor A|nr:30S ribosome-binding factor RbfA [Pseudomonadota bacterium]MDA0971437.1 30S ribosome-binding factor RbfA [Pseudomonadota bacterium]MDA0995885.1 30S ribosome-binding factor RbfA [Pseudomonadota bacterium]